MEGRRRWEGRRLKCWMFDRLNNEFSSSSGESYKLGSNGKGFKSYSILETLMVNPKTLESQIINLILRVGWQITLHFIYKILTTGLNRLFLGRFHLGSNQVIFSGRYQIISIPLPYTIQSAWKYLDRNQKWSSDFIALEYTSLNETALRSYILDDFIYCGLDIPQQWSLNFIFRSCLHISKHLVGQKNQRQFCAYLKILLGIHDLPDRFQGNKPFRNTKQKIVIKKNCDMYIQWPVEAGPCKAGDWNAGAWRAGGVCCKVGDLKASDRRRMKHHTVQSSEGATSQSLYSAGSEGWRCDTNCNQKITKCS